MGKSKNGYGRGTFIDTKLILSDAGLSLGQAGSCIYVSGVSYQILLMLLAKRQFANMRPKRGGSKGFTRTDDNRFTLTYKEIQSYGFRVNKKGAKVKGMITQPKATRAFDELLAKGFIEIVEQGGAYDKHKTQYALVDDYLTWRWGDAPIRERKKDFRRGYQGAKKGAAKK